MSNKLHSQTHLHKGYCWSGAIALSITTVLGVSLLLIPEGEALSNLLTLLVLIGIVVWPAFLVLAIIRRPGGRASFGVLADDDTYLNMLRETAEDARLRDWQLCHWSSSTAHADHSHCIFCWESISDRANAQGVTEAFTDGKEWICPRCYTRIVEGSQDPAVIIREIDTRSG
ncbi:MAG: hypothetical protein ACF8OB_16500 [Phycisphaeraceae bacterium JB051]